MAALTDEERFWSKVDKSLHPKGCWLWTAGCFTNGYGCFKYKGRSIKAHRYAYEIQNGPIPDGLKVLHECDNPPCIRGSHLFAGTDADNTDDRDTKGRGVAGRKYGALYPGHSQGERNGNAKLDWDKVRMIRTALEAGSSNKELAAEYQVTTAAINQIKNKTKWKE